MKKFARIISFLVLALPLYSLSPKKTNVQKQAVPLPQKQEQKKIFKNEQTFLLSKAFSFYYADNNKAIKIFQEYLNTYGDHLIPLRYLGIIYFRIGKIREAIKYMERAVKAGKEDIKTHELLGQLYLNARRYNDAEKIYLKILKLEPFNKKSLEILANFYERSRKERKSISFYKRLFLAGKRNSNTETLYLSLQKLGAYYYKTRRFKKAINSYEQLLELDAHNLKTSYILGDLYRLNGELEKARSKYEKVFKARPKNIKVHHLLIEIYYLTEDNKLRAAVDSFIEKHKKVSPLINALYSELNGGLNETEYLFRLALAKDPNLLSARIGLVKVYQKLKDYENLQKEVFITIYIAQKMRVFKIAQKYEIFMLNLLDEENKDINLEGILALKKPQKSLMSDRVEELAKIYIDLYSTHARTMDRLKLNRNTLSYYYKVLSLINGLKNYIIAIKGANTEFLKTLESKKYQVLLQVGWLLHLEPFEENPRALKVLQEAGRFRPKSSEHHFLTGIIRYRMGSDKKSHFKLASQSLKKAIRLEKVEKIPPNYFFYLGISLDKQNRFKEAEKTLKQAIRLDPDNSTYLNYLGYIYLVRGTKYDEASKLLLKALEDEPENEAYLDSLGWLWYKKGNYAKALVQLLVAADQAEKNNNIDPVIYFHLAETYIKLKKRDLAYHYFKKTLAKIKYASETLNVKYIRKRIRELSKK